MTSDIKSLLRLGIPISQRVSHSYQLQKHVNFILYYLISDGTINDISYQSYNVLGSGVEGNSRKEGNEMRQRKVPERLL